MLQVHVGEQQQLVSEMSLRSSNAQSIAMKAVRHRCVVNFASLQRRG